MISGHIRMSLGNLQAVESLDLSHNEISGSIPQTLDQLGKLTINIECPEDITSSEGRVEEEEDLSWMSWGGTWMVFRLDSSQQS
ncbi:leucine-rich repeat-containing protein [Tanacetum coccineum]